MLSGKEAHEFVAEARAKARRLRAETLVAAQAEAAARGKEPFDLSMLETMCDTTREGKLDPVEERQARFEEMYYTFYPSVMTLAEFAEKVEELNRW